MKHVLALAVLIGLAGFFPAKTNAQVITYHTEAKAMVETCLGHVHRWGTDPDELLDRGFIKRRMFGKTTYAKLPKHPSISNSGGRLNILEISLSKNGCSLYYAPARRWVPHILAQTEKLVMAAGYKRIEKKDKRGRVKTSYARKGAVLRIPVSYNGERVHVGFYDDS